MESATDAPSTQWTANMHHSKTLRWKYTTILGLKSVTSNVGPSRMVAFRNVASCPIDLEEVEQFLEHRWTVTSIGSLWKSLLPSLKI
jgi:hypothetical protein